MVEQNKIIGLHQNLTYKDKQGNQVAKLYHDYYQNIPLLEDKKVSLIIADPPYNMHMKNKNSDVVYDWDIVFNFREMLQRFKMMLDEDGTILVYNRLNSLEEIKYYCAEAGLKYQQTLMWIKPNPRPYITGYNITDNSREYILLISHADKTLSDLKFNWFPDESRYHPGIFEYKAGNEEDKNFMKWNNLEVHSTPKPIKLETELILRHSNILDKVWIPFGGSGVDAIAGVNMRRRIIISELDANYVELIDAKLLWKCILEQGDMENYLNKLEQNPDAVLTGENLAKRKAAFSKEKNGKEYIDTEAVQDLTSKMLRLNETRNRYEMKVKELDEEIEKLKGEDGLNL